MTKTTPTETNSYEIWQRQIIDTLWQEKWELSKIQPTPPLQTWYNTGRNPTECAQHILTSNTYKNTRKTNKTKSRKAKPPTYPQAPQKP